MCSKDWAAQNLFDNRLLNHCKQLRNYGTPGLFCFLTFIYVRLSTQPWFSSHCCSATNQDVLTDAVLCITQHCVGVDALKRWRETYGAMHRVLANPLFMQLCIAPCNPPLPPQSPIFAIMHGKPGLFSRLPISAPHPIASKQSPSNCITLLSNCISQKQPWPGADHFRSHWKHAF